jgi:hypothetical protein
MAKSGISGQRYKRRPQYGHGNCLFSHAAMGRKPFQGFSDPISDRGKHMVNQCANPKCGKPLHYLREGRIFVFDLPDPDVPVPAPGGRAQRLQHFWLCGACSESMVMEQAGNLEIRVTLKKRKLEPVTTERMAG